MTTLWKMKEKRGTHGRKARKRCKVENTIYTAGGRLVSTVMGLGVPISRCGIRKTRKEMEGKVSGRTEERTSREKTAENNSSPACRSSLFSNRPFRPLLGVCRRRRGRFRCLFSLERSIGYRRCGIGSGRSRCSGRRCRNRVRT